MGSLSFSTRGERVMFSENEETESDEFKRFDYIPSQNRSKHLKYACFICSIVAVLILIIIIAENAGKSSFATSSKIKTLEMNDFRGELFLTINDTKIVKFNYNSRNLDLVLEAPETSVIAAFVVHADKSIHWIDSNASRIVAQSTKDVKVLLEERRFKPEGLALYQISENIYVVDKAAGTLVVINIRNGYYAILLTDLVNAKDITLDSERGLMFILQQSNSVLRANMDGSEPTEVVTNSGITALTIDTNRKRLYWINNFVNIESSNYDGEKRQSVFTDTVTIVSITILDDHLFWTWPNHQQSTTLLSCQIDLDDTCKDHATHKINATGNVKSIRAFSKIAASISNPCQFDNGGCEDLCLPIGRNQSTCACRMGWQLNPDHRTCHEVRDFVLYIYGNFIKTCSLDGKQEIFWPTPYKTRTLSVKTEIDFDYDLKNDVFYFSDDHHIHRIYLKSYAGQEIILTVNSSDTIIEDIAYDWLTGNTYFGQRHTNASLDHSLVVFNPRLGEAYRRDLEILAFDGFKARYYAMALHPAKGYLFVAVTPENDVRTYVFCVEISDARSTRKYHFFADGSWDHRFFTIDYATDRIYEIQETGEVTWIAYIPVEGTKLELGMNALVNARTISVHQQWLYLSNLSSIYRFDKGTMGFGVRIAPRVEDPAKKIFGVRVISEEVQLANLHNPCAKNNGGCEQFCFIGSKATCACRNGQKVKSDGHCY